MTLKDTWKETGSSLGHAFKSLGKAIVKSVATAFRKADKWASSDEKPKGAKAEEPKVEETKTEEIKTEEPAEQAADR